MKVINEKELELFLDLFVDILKKICTEEQCNKISKEVKLLKVYFNEK